MTENKAERLGNGLGDNNGQVAIPPVSAGAGVEEVFEAIVRKTGKNPFEVLLTTYETDQSPESSIVAAFNQEFVFDYIRKMPPAFEAYWIDAGWFEGGWPLGVGNPDPDPKKFPRSMKPISDAAH